ncbi:MAG: hypothetical protein ABI591_01325 [Kofleriaceae bacterium]
MRAVWFVAVLAACGTDPTQIQLVVAGPQPVYFMAQIAGRPWQTIDGVYDGLNNTYELAIDGDFELVMVCSDTAFQAGELFGTVADAIVTIGSWHPPCAAPPPMIETGGPKLEVTGQLDQQGFVSIGSQRVTVNDPTQPFRLEIPAGSYDVAITSFNFVVGIFHDRVISGPTDLGLLSFTTASPMLTNDYEFALDTDEVADAATTVVTRNNTILQFTYPPSRAVFVSGDQLSYGDHQSFTFSTGRRSASVLDFASVPGQFDLLATLRPYAWDKATRSVQWSPTGEFFTTASIEFSDGTNSEAVTESKRWIDQHDPQVLAVDETGPPGYRWAIGAGINSMLEVELWSSDLVLVSRTGQSFQPVR